MTEIPENVRELVERHFWKMDPEDQEKICAVVLADRASRPAAVPRVKPLEWEEARFSDKWHRFQAESIFGYYEALEFSDGGFGFSCPPAIDDNHLTTKPADSIENSKAAAQADYEKRVLSALAAALAAPQAKAGTEELVAALAEMLEVAPRNEAGPRIDRARAILAKHGSRS